MIGGMRGVVGETAERKLEDSMYQAFLVKYGEIGLKGNNRHIFENALKNRIMDSLRPLGEAMTMRIR